MSNTVSVGRRLILIEQIALIEPFEPSPDNPLRSQKEFKSRIVLLSRDSVLAEFDARTFAEEHGFRLLEEDGAATNPSVPFSVEAFEPTVEFQPSKPFRSRLVWRGVDGSTKSKLLLTSPEAVLAMAVRGEQEPDGLESMPRVVREQRPSRRRKPRANDRRSARSRLERVLRTVALCAPRTEPRTRVSALRVSD